MARPALRWAAFLGVLFVAVQARAQEPGTASPPIGAEGRDQRLSVLYSDGFVLRSADGEHELRIAASGQLDGRYYPGSAGSPDSFDIRRARLDLGAKVFGWMDVRVQAAFEDTPYLRNAFVDFNFHRWIHLRVGQFKVPFSTQWLTLDNQADFMERATAEPLYPFIDRGAMVWGQLFGRRLVYNLGVFTGAGVDLDAPKGDIDHKKEVAYRLFTQPFRDVGPRWIQRLYLAGAGTWESASYPTNRFEKRGLVTADFESLMWRWRTDQVLGTNGRDTDQIAGTIGHKMRWGAEAHYLVGPLTVSAEWAMIDYDDVTIYHDLWQGSTLVKHDPVAGNQGQHFAIHNFSVFVSVFLTGEQKYLDNFGWRQPTPKRRFSLRRRGIGAWEVLARFSRTWIPDRHHYHGAFTSVSKVAAFTAADATGIKGPLPAEGASVNAQVLDGAKLMYETTVGLNWTLNYHCRVQLDYTYLVAPKASYDAATGRWTDGLLTGGNSENADLTTKNKVVKSEHEVGVRFIFRI
jgi:phosphate-selective porin